jgi:indolepyruvate ferredoxin oxidoreductase alpha subunit
LPDPLLKARAGERLCVLGNEAIARGALEAGVRFVSGYPGTPASEIGDTLFRLHREAAIHFEWSVNEKIALESAFGAAIMGGRALCYMKHLGLAYAGDPLGTIPYIGVKAGMVIVSAGDPGMVVSPNEQDQRYFGKMHSIPVLEPCTPEEARSMTRFAFELSEESGLPVILRTTPAVAHTRGIIDVAEIPEETGEATFERRPAQLTPIPVNARRMRVELDARLAKAESLLAGSTLFEREGSGRVGVLAVGAPLALVEDQLEEMDLGRSVTLQKLGATWPIPREVLAGFIEQVDRVLVVEELTPFVENELRGLAFELNPDLEILGKRSGHLPDRFAYDHAIVGRALAEFCGVEWAEPEVAEAPQLPPRPPALCPGCPHRGAYLAVRSVFAEEGIYFNDIVCYTFGYGTPLEIADAVLAMGSSIAMASAASRVLGRKTLAFIGDSTFFHSGMPALLNAAEAGDDILVVVLDNRITGMTGHQPSPSTPREDGAERPTPEAVARAVGVKNVRTVDPLDLEGTVAAVMEAKQGRGPAVVVARRECTIVRFREEGAKPERKRFIVDHELCRHCGHDSSDLHCGQGPVKEHERAMVLRRLRDGDRVLAEPDTPCTLACPANICVQGYIGRITGGRYAEALAMIRRRNALPVVSSRVCHRPCEKVCARVTGDGPLAINDLKRWLADWEMANPGAAAKLEVGEPSGHRVAVVGAGPSGLTCAVELRRRGHEVVIFDEHDAPGGVLVQGIPEHRLPRDELSYETDWVLDHGIEFKGGIRLGQDIHLEQLLDDFGAVYLGIGAMAGIPLSAPGGDSACVVQALDLLRSHHRGERIDAAGMRCIVIGGGDAAVDAARVLVRLGAATVTVVYRRDREEMPAHPEEVDAAEEEGIVLRLREAPVAVKDSGELRIIRTEPGAPDASGRRSPVNVPGSEEEIEAELIVAAIGQRPELSFVNGELRLTEGGYVEIDPESGATSMAGVFAGGDITPGPKTVIHAIADGRRAAWGIDLHMAEDRAAVPPVEFLTIDELQFTPPTDLVAEPSHRAALRPAAERRGDHEDVIVPLTEAEAREEAARCLFCATCGSCSACTDLFGCPAFREEDGRMVIDDRLCSGCGVCVTFCPNGAIREVGD